MAFVAPVTVVGLGWSAQAAVPGCPADSSGYGLYYQGFCEVSWYALPGNRVSFCIDEGLNFPHSSYAWTDTTTLTGDPTAGYLIWKYGGTTDNTRAADLAVWIHKDPGLPHTNTQPPPSTPPNQSMYAAMSSEATQLSGPYTTKVRIDTLAAAGQTGQVSVAVLARSGTALPNGQVHVTVSNGRFGGATSTTVTTDATGWAHLTYTASSTPGPVVFTATGINLPATAVHVYSTSSFSGVQRLAGAPAASTASPGTARYISLPVVASLQVLKVDPTGTPLAGAVFTINPATNSGQTTATTDNTGHAVFLNVVVGRTYTVTETTPSPGYALPSPASQTVTAGATATLTFTDRPNTVTIVKTGVGGAPLAGAVFTLTGGGRSWTFPTTASSGHAALSLIPAGSYSAVEVTPPAGYAVDPNPIPVTMPAGGGDVTVPVSDGENIVTLHKTDASTGVALAGAVYTLTGSGRSWTFPPTDATGSASLAGIPAGTYTATETQAPPGYTLNTTPVAVVVPAAGGDVSVSATDTANTIVLSKTDQTSGRPLSGAVFTLSDGTRSWTFPPTDASGQASLSGIPAGTYALTETTPPSGYALPPAPMTVTMPATGGVVGVTAADTPNVVTLTKTDRASGAALAGAVYTLSGGGQSWTFPSTDTAGMTSLSGIPAGSYTAVETQAPAGYTLDTTPIPVVVAAAGGTVTVSATDTADTVTLAKTDRATGGPLAGAVYELRDAAGATVATFPVTDSTGTAVVSRIPAGSYLAMEVIPPAGYTLDSTPIPVVVPAGGGAVRVAAGDTANTLTITKTDARSGQLLSGAVFQLTVCPTASSSGSVVATFPATDLSGQTHLSGVVAGAYCVFELSPPPGYTRTTTPWPVTMPAAGGALTLAATDLPNGVKLHKTDRSGATSLAGAVYELTDCKQPPTVLATFPATDANGQATLAGPIPAGSYCAVEVTPPTGYTLNTSPIPVSMPADGGTITVSAADDANVVTLTKTDAASGADLAGAVYQLTDCHGTVWGTFPPTSASGLATLTGVPAGAWCAVELTPPPGYALGVPLPISMTANGGAVTVSVHDLANVVVLHKTDRGSGVNLAGAVYDLTACGTGKVVATFPPTSSGGLATVSGIPAGCYEAAERTSPPGYTVDTHPLPVTMPAAGGSVTVSATDTADVVALHKMDRVSGADLSGASYDLTDCHGRTVASFPATKRSGLATVTGIRAGAYCAIERTPPSGYFSSLTPIRVTVPKAGGDVTVSAMDLAAPVVLSPELPFTGLPLVVIASTSLVSLTMGMLMLIVGRRRRDPA